MHSTHAKDLKRRFLVVLKAATFFICVAGFVGNSFMIFKQFISKQTITSQDVQKNDELVLPSFTMCSLSAFKEKMNKYRDVELDNFHNKTLELDEILLWVEDMTIDELRENTTTWEITATYGPYKGRCYTIRYLPKVTDIYLTDISYQIYLGQDFKIVNSPFLPFC